MGLGDVGVHVRIIKVGLAIVLLSESGRTACIGPKASVPAVLRRAVVSPVV